MIGSKLVLYCIKSSNSWWWWSTVLANPFGAGDPWLQMINFQTTKGPTKMFRLCTGHCLYKGSQQKAKQWKYERTPFACRYKCDSIFLQWGPSSHSALRMCMPIKVELAYAVAMIELAAFHAPLGLHTASNAKVFLPTPSQNASVSRISLRLVGILKHRSICNASPSQTRAIGK